VDRSAASSSRTSPAAAATGDAISVDGLDQLSAARTH
jgi:hypothetical protein